MTLSRKTATAATILAIAAGITAVTANPPAQAATTTPDVVVGNTAAASYWFAQTTGDCEEGAFDAVFGAIRGARMHEATVVAEAQKLGVMSHNTADGSNWVGPDGLAKLAAHYGIRMTVGAHTITTIETDLKAGDHVIAAVSAGIIWNNIPAFVAADGFQTVDPYGDHALVLDSIDETAKTVTLTDTGWAGGRAETVPLSVFNQSMTVSGYQYAVTTRTGK